MFGTGLRIMRFHLALAFGKRLHPGNAQQLVRAATRTLAEFGSFGDDAAHLLEGPAMDSDMERMALERTIRYLARTSVYYQKRFAALPFPLASLDREHLCQVPVTKKFALENSQDFLAQGTRPFLSVCPPESVGPPTRTWFSREELQLMVALAGMDAYATYHHEYLRSFQVNLPPTAFVATQTLQGMADLLGARINLPGLDSVDLNLEQLIGTNQQAPTMLITYPRFLAELVTAARQQGLGPKDFCLQQIECTGEILSSSLARAASETFGASVREHYYNTEINPAGGTICQAGHFHTNSRRGLFETISLETGEPAEVGELATLVVTPYYPYRLCMPLLRYDTRDIVRILPKQALTCELAHLPATSPLLGKAEHLLKVGSTHITTRDLVEACDSLPFHPWATRFRACVTSHGIALTLPKRAFHEVSTSEMLAHFERAYLPVYKITSVPEDQQPDPLRRERLVAYP